MGNSNSAQVNHKYNKHFTKEELNDPTKFDIGELFNTCAYFKSDFNAQTEVVRKGIDIVNENENFTLKIGSDDLTKITIKDTQNNINYAIRNICTTPLPKYCVKINNKKEYCGHDISIIDVCFDFQIKESKL